MSTNKLVYVFLALTGLILTFSLGINFFVDKVSDRVIQKLKQDYSPSPYGPTIDPDKIDLNKVNIKVDPSL
jgi:hypothetical protein